MSLLLTALAASCSCTQTLLIERGTQWRYLDDGSNQGTSWVDPQFDDSAWSVGTAEFGYGDGDEQTVIDFGDDPADKHITTYFRRDFFVNDPADFEALEFRLQRDDGALVYLNGVEVFRSNMSDGPVTAKTRSERFAAGGSEEVFFPFYDRTSDLVPGVNTLAVEVHLSVPNSPDCTFDLELIGHEGPSVIRGPYVQMVSPTAATIRFRTVAPTVGRVTYGDSPTTLQQSVSGTQLAVEHELRITGLEPGTRYSYAVGNPQGTLAGGDADHWFRTAPPVGSPTPTRIWALGDAGTYNDNQRRVRDAYGAFSANRETDLMLFLGDNAYRVGNDIEYQVALFEMYDEWIRNTPAWSTRGNHELDANAYFKAFTLPDQAQAGGLPSGVEDYYSFDFANIHFVCLDSWASDKSLNGPMYTWCEADLQSTAQDWIIAYFHHPPYSKGSHDSDLEANLIDMRKVFVPLLEDHGVAVVLSGHSHTYERSYLIDQHYGASSTFSVGIHAVDAGLGREVNGTGGYVRAPGPHGGAVYMVAGCSGQVSSNGTLDHAAMVWSERELGSVVLDVVGGRMDVTFLDDAGAPRDWFTLVDSTWDGTFCIGSVNGEGCVATLSTAGTPSVSSGQPFSVIATEVRTNATSFLVYGPEAYDRPLAGGRLCVGPSLRRTLPGNSGGAAPCSGAHTFDFSTIWGSPMHSGLTVGARIHCQVWYRDTTPEASSLSEGLLFTIQP
ncbi:MAG: metallophosphoesterase family protein [Planctomycetota bacterium]